MDKPMQIDKLYSFEVEENIIGSMIIDLNSCIKVLELNCNYDDFYNSRNQVLFSQIKEIFRSTGKIDLIILLEELKDKVLLESVGGITRVSEIATSVITTSNIESYVDLLKAYSQKRKLIDISKYIQGNLFKNVDEIQQEVTNMLGDVIEGKSFVETVESQELDYLNTLGKRMSGEIKALSTGLSDIDKEIVGFNGGDLITIFAFSGVGKTALANQIGLNIIRQKKRVLFFSLEMPKEQIRDRMISNITNIPFKKIKYSDLNDNEMESVVKANSYISRNKGILISEEDELMSIIGKIQIEVMRNDVDIIFIDYINLINISGNFKEEHHKVTECTRQLKKVAKMVNKPIVILAQGKQESASKIGNKNLGLWEKVAVNDIAGGASIYRDSDIVLGMYRNIELDNKIVREKMIRENERSIDYSSKHADKNPECINLLIKKSRASGKAIVNLKWKAETYGIRDWY